MKKLMMALLLVAVGGTAWAGQDDARLDGLFERLLSAGSPGEARPIENQIWNIWFTYDGSVERVDELLARGVAALNRSRLDAAERQFTRTIDLDPSFAEAWNRRATVRFMKGDYLGSVADIQETLALEPRHFGALSGLGLVMMQLEEHQRALNAFEAAVEIHPQMSGARANIESLQELLAGDAI